MILSQYVDQGSEVMMKIMKLQNKIASIPVEISMKIEKKILGTIITIYEQTSGVIPEFIRVHTDSFILKLKRVMAKTVKNYPDLFFNTKLCTEDEKHMVNPYLTRQRKLTESDLALLGEIPERVAIIEELVDCGERQMAAVSANFGIQVT